MMDKILNLIKTQICRIIFNCKIEDNIWIFSSTNNRKFNYNSKYMFEYILSNEPEIKPYYVINDDILRKQMQEKYGDEYFINTKNAKGILKVLSARVWLTSAGLPLYGFGLGKRRIIVNLWHGVPLKKIALMENNYGIIKKIYFKKIFSNNYRYILTTSNKLTTIMKNSFGVNENKIKVWGQPRNDVLFKGQNKKIIQSSYPDINKYERIILYAPTYREYKDTMLFPFDDYSKNQLNMFLQDKKAIIFIKTHIDETANTSEYIDDRVRLLNEDMIEDIMVVLNTFDVLITDYSSIYIDYLLLERPMIFLPYDKDEYLTKRGMNFEYDKVTPGYKPKSMKEFLESLNMIFEKEDIFEKERKSINSLFNDIKEPCSAKICSYIKHDICELKSK